MSRRKGLARQRHEETVSGGRTENTKALNKAQEKSDAPEEQREGQCGCGAGEKRRAAEMSVKNSRPNKPSE